MTHRRLVFQASLVYSKQSPGKGSLRFSTGCRDLEYVRGTDVGLNLELPLSMLGMTGDKLLHSL